MHFVSKDVAILSVCYLALVSGAAAAEQKQSKFGGFLNQALVNTTGNQFFGNSDDSLSADYWEAGLLLGGDLTPKLDVSSVLLARRAGEIDDGHPRIDQILFTYHFQDEFDQSQGFRLGRTKQRFGLYNQTRDVPFTRPGILMPQSTYLDRERNTLLIVDDLSYYYEKRSEEWGSFHFDVAGFKNHPIESEFEDFINYDVSVDIEGKNGWGFLLNWRSPMEEWLLGVSAGETGTRFYAENTNLFNSDRSFNLVNTDGNFDIQAVNLFVQYTHANWQLTSEVTFTNSIFKNLNTLTEKLKAQSLSYYVQADYHFNERHSLFARYDVHQLDRHDPKGTKFAESPFGMISGTPNYARYSIDHTLGYAWLPHPDWMVRAELHNVEGCSWLSHLENENTRALVKYWNLAMLQISYRF